MDTQNLIRLKRTNSDDAEFRKLIVELDKYLVGVFGKQQEFYDEYNVINNSSTVVVAYRDGAPVGCGCLREFDAETVEVKRMFVPEEYRSMGIASAVLRELEQWAKELNYKQIILETGTLLDAANAFYKKAGYDITEKWGQYVDAENSVCMRKVIA